MEWILCWMCPPDSKSQWTWWVGAVAVFWCQVWLHILSLSFHTQNWTGWWREHEISRNVPQVRGPWWVRQNKISGWAKVCWVWMWDIHISLLINRSWQDCFWRWSFSELEQIKWCSLLLSRSQWIDDNFLLVIDYEQDVLKLVW